MHFVNRTCNLNFRTYCKTDHKNIIADKQITIMLHWGRERLRFGSPEVNGESFQCWLPTLVTIHMKNDSALDRAIPTIFVVAVRGGSKGGGGGGLGEAHHKNLLREKKGNTCMGPKKI